VITNGRGEVYAPSGCTYCGAEERGHSQRWAMGVGIHRWTAPTLWQRKERMKARRALFIAGGWQDTPIHDQLLAEVAHRSVEGADR
jgi:hypothetical protein